MWFRNLQIHRIAPDATLEADAFAGQLVAHAFQPCTSLMLESRGWIPPRGDDRLVCVLNHQWLLALGVEKKLLPSSVIRQNVQQRAAEIESMTGMKPGRKRQRELKEEVTDELLPRAFSTYRTTFAWIDPAARWLMIDASSEKRGEEFMEHVRKSVTDAPFALVRTGRSPSAAMAEWLIAREAPAGFTIDRECVLQSPLEEKSTVRYTRHTLVDTDEIRNHIRDGKQPIQLALTWQDRVSFVLTDKCEIRKAALLEMAKPEDQPDAESAEAQFETDFVLMTGMMGGLIADLIEALGGEAE
ncbi:MAG: recombination-associated protein RdgC [Burkholderiales bacterium]